MWQITTSSNEKNARNFTSNEMKSTKYEGGTRFAQTNTTEMILRVHLKLNSEKGVL